MSYWNNSGKASDKKQKEWVPFDAKTHTLESYDVIDLELLNNNLGASIIHDKNRYWVKAAPFQDTLKIGPYCWGRSCGCVRVTSKTTGRSYYINARDFMDYAANGAINNGEISGTYKFVKRGTVRYIERTGG